MLTPKISTSKVLTRTQQHLLRAIRLGIAPLLVASTVVASGFSSQPASASPVGSLQAQAQQLAAQVASANAKISALAEAYNGALYEKQQLDAQIAQTEKQIASDRQAVTANQLLLQKAAINAYVNNGANGASASLFTSADNSAVAASVYHQVAANNVADAVAGFTTAVDQLNVRQSTLAAQRAQASAKMSAANAARSQANQLSADLSAQLAGVKGQLAGALAAEQAAQAAAAAAAARRQLENAGSGSGGYGGSNQTPIIPPPSSGHGSSVASAAEAYLGVPYVWGGVSPNGMDCSGLIVLAFSAVGISMPHYSGAQYAIGTPVPVSNLQPGDLLFYGPGGSEHVSIYLGGGMMVEAPHTGAVVWNSPVRFGYDFAGARRI
jgi:cell wall-associated NlpC family hydrolase